MTICEIDGCDKPRRKRGWCEMHYSRFKVHGTPHAPAKRSAGDHCVAPECEDRPVAKGQCRKHYYANKLFRKQYREGTARTLGPKTLAEDSVSAHIRNSSQPCKVEDCHEPSMSRGWCGAHYQRWRRFGDPTFTPPEANKQCRIEGCEGVTNARELCSQHYYRWQKFGDPEATPIRKSGIKSVLDDRLCKVCGEVFSPGNSRARLYCGRKCVPSRPGGGVNRRAVVERLAKRDGWRCHLCAGDIDGGLYWPNRHAGSVDHIIPVFHGGTDGYENLALAHLTCNVSRGARLLDELDE